jgi:HNH endonuclease
VPGGVGRGYAGPAASSGGACRGAAGQAEDARCTVRDRQASRASQYAEAAIDSSVAARAGYLSLMPPTEFTADEYRRVIEDAIRARIERGEAAGGIALEPIAFERTVLEPKVNLPRRIKVQVYRRDHYTCRYCSVRTVPEPVLRLLAELYPSKFPHDVHWKAGHIHRAIPLLCTEVDHLVPIARGGSSMELANLRTACAPCNTRKSDFLLSEVGMDDRPVDTSGWDGMTLLYRKLWEAVGSPDEPPFHRDWIASFEGT